MNTATMTRRLRPWLGSLLLLAAGPYALSQEAAQTTAIDPPGRVARLGYIEGEVSMLPAGSAAPSEAPAEDWMEATLNRPLTSGDTLWVGSDGRAQLQTGSSDIYLDHGTGFGFILLDDDVMQMSLTEGAATVRVRRLAERETIQVETPNAGVVLRRPGEYHLMIAADDRTIVKTRSGEAQVEDGRQSYTVGDGQAGTFGGPDGPPGSLAALAPRDEFETWANERDRRGEHSRSASYVSTDVVGYEDLDEHGEWRDEPGYGPVWRPLYAASDWAPYRYGQWTWIAPWGWTWVDDARWGFAPFHYGRWAQVRSRWCWVPGPRHLRPVYAPALVGWTGPSLSVVIGLGSGVGWFPLAPREIYRPWYRHTPRYVRRVNHANTFIDRTRISDLYTRRQPPHRHQYERTPGAVTVVPRARFSGHPVGAHRVAVNDRELRQWRENGRAPAFIAGRDRHFTANTARQPPPARTSRRSDAPRGQGETPRGIRHRGDDRPAGAAWRDSRAGEPERATPRVGHSGVGAPRADNPRVDDPKTGGDFYTTRTRTAGAARTGTSQTHPQGRAPDSTRPRADFGAAEAAPAAGTPQAGRPQSRGEFYSTRPHTASSSAGDVVQQPTPRGARTRPTPRDPASRPQNERTVARERVEIMSAGNGEPTVRRFATSGVREAATSRRGTSAATPAAAPERRSASPPGASRTPTYTEPTRSAPPQPPPHRATSNGLAPDRSAPHRPTPSRHMDQNRGPRQGPPAPRSTVENTSPAARPGASAARSSSSLRRHKD